MADTKFLQSPSSFGIKSKPCVGLSSSDNKQPFSPCKAHGFLINDSLIFPVPISLAVIIGISSKEMQANVIEILIILVFLGFLCYYIIDLRFAII